MTPKAIAWAIAHPVEAATLAASAVALLRGLYALLARVLAPYPRARAAVEAVAALAPDVLRAVLDEYGYPSGAAEVTAALAQGHPPATLRAALAAA